MKKITKKVNKSKTNKAAKVIKKTNKKVVHSQVGKVKKNTKIKAVPQRKTKVKLEVKIKTKARSKIKPANKSSLVKKISPKKPSNKAVFGPVDIQPYFLKEKENYMNEKQLKHFREILLHWKEQLMNDVDRTVHNMQDGSSNYPDPVDRASQEEEFSLELRTRDRERKLLKKIEETLMRINDDDYGYCDDCGAEIGVRRLEARPTATQCIECKTIAEIREKQVGESN